MGRSIVYFCASTGDIFVSITDGHVSMDELFDLSSDRLQFSGHQYVADKLMRTAGSRILIIGSLD